MNFRALRVLDIARFAALLPASRMREARAAIEGFRAQLDGRVVWNVSSTAIGGGVAEMIRPLLGYARGVGVDVRWAVMEAEPEFFRITKRLHDALHGAARDSPPIGDAERLVYEATAELNLAELEPLVRAGDLVIVHDPQPAGMIPRLVERGAVVVWRCHIGSDMLNEEAERGWRFLVRYIRDAEAYVFSRHAYVPRQLDARKATIIPPSLDPFSAKNAPLSDEAVRAILGRADLIADETSAAACVFAREDGTPGRVDRAAKVLREGAPPSWRTPLVVQVSRWDWLKDPIGVLEGFARIDGADGHLVLAGVDVGAVADDPEGAAAYDATVAAWRALPEAARRRCSLASLPSVDVDENAAIVNALQRHAAVVVQKSLHEGFGLTVTEAMWKARPVVASAVGGIRDQVEDGVNGLLLPDARDLDAFAAAVAGLLRDPALSSRLGEAARRTVAERYLGIDSLLHYGALLTSLVAQRDLAH